MRLVVASDVVNTVLTGLGIVVGCAALGIVGFIFVLRFLPHRRRPQYTPFVHAVYGVVGVLYAVLAAFVVVVIWQSYSAAGTQVQTEAATVDNLFRESAELPQPLRNSVRNHLLTYTNDVATKEWLTMAKGDPDLQTTNVYNGLWSLYTNYQPRTVEQQLWYQTTLANLAELDQARRSRINLSRSKVNILLWILLIAGGFLTLGFTFFLWTPVARRQGFVIAALGSLIGFVLFLADSLQLPFTGGVRISPTAFTELYDQYRHLMTPEQAIVQTPAYANHLGQKAEG